MEKEKTIETYIRRLELIGLSKSSIYNRKRLLSRFVDFLGDKDFKETTEADILDFLAYLEGKERFKKGTRAIYISRLKGFFDWLVKQGKINNNPTEDLAKAIRRTADDKREIPELSLNDIRRLVLAAGSPRNKAMLLLLFKSGLRARELISLNRSDIDWKTGKVIVRRRKGGKSGFVFIDDETMRVLRFYLSLRIDNEEPLFATNGGNRLSYEALWLTVKTIGKKIGIKDLRPHDFRHLFTTFLQRNRCHPEVIRILRGDSNGNMSSYYTHFTEDEVRAEYLRAIPKLYV
ncbi:hypothetical protein DRP07_12645 [Archaeoglobales archaeon]|nr:MAG: hypothetical protein DRP07_12645 [Archaeoglobales archaeon]